jgi:hypothetical protein
VQLVFSPSSDVDSGEVLLDVAEQAFVPLDGKRIVHAALHEDLRAADGDEFADLLADFFVA